MRGEINMERYLTKSRFKLAISCPTKLFYTAKKDYANQSTVDSFLESLAEGGYQVGALAQCYFPGGVVIETLDYTESLNKTNELMKNKKAIIFEGAFRYQNLFIRADIIYKQDKILKLIEVKSKSYDPEDGDFTNSKGISSGWIDYLYDVAFQTYVIRKAYPDLTVISYLMLADKSITALTDGLNQKFIIDKLPSGRIQIKVSDKLTKQDLIPELLVKVDVTELVDSIINNKIKNTPLELGFEESIKNFASCYEKDIKIDPVPSKNCGGCEFVATTEDELAGLKSGFKECWKECFKLKDLDFLKPLSISLWNSRKKDDFIACNKIFLADIKEQDLDIKQSEKDGLSGSERQWLQIKKVKEKDNSYYVDKKGLKSALSKLVYPFHLIDFETTKTALPFYKGMRPYEAVAFQYSHHLLNSDGTVEHKGEYINTQKGLFPNFDFVRHLKKELASDNGTIFCYSHHENSILNAIYWQLDESNEKDKKELQEFIQEVTHSSGGSSAKWTGSRDMFDMLKAEKLYHYDPATNGSNSIKYVLPAILNSSTFLKKKYSKPIYGAKNGIKSLNFKDWVWVDVDKSTGLVKNPYDLLPKLFDSENLDAITSGEDEGIKEGGAAMTAYGRMQFSEISEEEHHALAKSLLKYCELDTFAMVMIMEFWLKEV